jgi:2-aminoadipate transaminase
MLANRMSKVKPSAIRELLALGERPDIISFGGGYPDPALFPLEELGSIYHEAVTRHGREALQYTVSTGLPRLREQLAARLTAHGTPTHFDEILILQGAQQGLDLVAKLLVDPGDLIMTENPTFLGALIAFNPCEPRYAAIPIDGDGMDMDALESRLTDERPKFIYTIPDFQNPTGACMSLKRRQRLIALADRYDIMILEDAPYREIRFEGDQLPSLRSLDPNGHVIHLGSFSKVLAPGMRIGWAVGDRDLIHQLGLLKLAADTQCSTLNMVAASTFLDRCDADALIANIRGIYRHKKELALSVIGDTFPPVVRHTDPSGGMFTWLTFPDSFDSAAFMREEALPRAKVAFVPGATFFPCREEHHHARLSFAGQSDDRIRAGLGALGALLGEALAALDSR